MPSAAGMVFCFDGACWVFGAFEEVAADDAAVFATCEVFGRPLTGIVVSDRKRKKRLFASRIARSVGSGVAASAHRRETARQKTKLGSRDPSPFKTRTKSLRIENIFSRDPVYTRRILLAPNPACCASTSPSHNR